MSFWTKKRRLTVKVFYRRHAVHHWARHRRRGNGVHVVSGQPKCSEIETSTLYTARVLARLLVHKLNQGPYGQRQGVGVLCGWTSTLDSWTLGLFQTILVFNRTTPLGPQRPFSRTCVYLFRSVAARKSVADNDTQRAA